LVRLPPFGKKLVAPITFEELIALSSTVRKDYGRSASIKGRPKTKDREANDPAYAQQRSKTVKGYKDKE
jgi:hypothetical protein